MGKRLIRNWINQPLIEIEPINRRLNAVDFLFKNGMIRGELRQHLKNMSDMDRINNRVLSGRSNPRDLLSLGNSFGTLPDIIQIFGDQNLALFSSSEATMQALQDEAVYLERAISEDAPANLFQSGVIRQGFSEELDQLVESTSHSRQWIADLENVEKKRTGIKTLKVGYNKVYGYYIEISRSYLKQVPAEYIRKQTLVNAERFITPELKEYETLVLNAEERILDLEKRLFDEICRFISRSADKIIQTSRFIARLDVLLAFAQTAADYRYTRPVLHDDNRLIIQQGRHPVVERSQQEIPFIPNDTLFQENEIIHIITGPNMSGKSTYLRQVALIVLLAQIGSFVPAEHAEIGLVDRIFTRIGAQDEIATGQSTFMVEMVETANILHNATRKSLLILDEIGRGTSTYDGLSMAWAIIENIHNNPRLQSRTLFATHYHELTQMSDIFPGIRNYSVAVSETEGKIIFLHKIIQGGADRSYGIHVAQLAGIPIHVIKRAYELLNKYESQTKDNRPPSAPFNTQIPLFIAQDPLLEELKIMELNNLSPIDALNKLYEWKSKYLN
jgi:DNA mismatch repair protein MutS